MKELKRVEFTVPEIRLKAGERGALIGSAGSGKSSLAKALLEKEKSLVVVDPKRDFDMPGLKIFNNADKLIKYDAPRSIYRPDVNDFVNMTEYNKVYEHVFNSGDMTVYTDDPVGIMSVHKFPLFMQACYQLGRSKGITCLSAFQRPTLLPGFVMSECRRFYAFLVPYPPDVKKLTSMIPGYSPSLVKKRYSFAYFEIYGEKTPVAEVLQLDLTEKGV